MDNNELQSQKDEICALVDGNEVANLCQQLVRIPSENPPCDVQEITDFICGYLKANGLEYEVLEGEPGKPNIVSRIKGCPGGKTLILCGHLDVVPAGELAKWKVPPYAGEIRDGYLHGRGASDMKGGVAGILVAFKAASRLRQLPGDVVLVLNPDEETGGHVGAKWLLDNTDLDGDGCLIAEPSKDDPTVGQKGSCWVRVATRGVPGHGSLAPVGGENAIAKMCKAIDALYSVWEKDWEIPDEIKELLADSKALMRERKSIPGLERILDHVTVNIGVIRGGDKVNKIPDYCEVEVDMRIPFGVEPEEVLSFVRSEFERREVEAEIEPLRWLSKANYTLPTEEIVKSVVACAEEITGRPAKPCLQWASSDARHFRAKGIPTIQYGPAELEGIHSYNEMVSLEELKSCAKVYAAVIVDFLSR